MLKLREAMFQENYHYTKTQTYETNVPLACNSNP